MTTPTCNQTTRLMHRRVAACLVWPATALGISALIGCGGPPPEAAEDPIPMVTVTPVVQRTISLPIPAVGTVLPSEASRVASPTAGMVVSFPLREGAFVQEGQPLASLRTVTLEIEIEQAKAVLKEKEQVLAEFTAGTRPEEIAQAEARMKAAQAQATYAVTQAERIDELFKKQARAVTERERDAAAYDAERARQESAEAQADYKLKKSGYRSEQIEAARAAASAQRKVVERLQDELAKKTIRAPFTGYLVQKQTEVGEWLEIGETVGTVARLDEVEVRVNVEESHVHEIRLGQQVDVRVDALGEATLPGVANSVIPRSEWSSGSRSFPVVVRMKNRISEGRPQLNEGMVARITFRGEPRDALLAHKDAIVRSSGRPVVFVVGENQRVRAVQVEEGISDGEYVEVNGDVHSGDLLVTEGVERLRPFEQVAILKDQDPTKNAENLTENSTGQWDDSSDSGEL